MNNHVEMLRQMYPKGTKLKLLEMDDSQAPPSGCIGTVIHVDDIGQIHMAWENGSTLALNTDVDEFERVF